MTERTATGPAASALSSRILWFVPVILCLDQISKYLVIRFLDPSRPWPADAEYFRLTYIHNPGAAFGLDLGSLHLHTVISVIALGLLVWLFRSLPAEARLSQFALVMVLGGALGNIIDRLVHDAGVVDFFDVGVSEQWRWPIFNVADSFVTIGIVLLALGYHRHRPAESDTDTEVDVASPEAAEHAESR